MNNCFSQRIERLLRFSNCKNACDSGKHLLEARPFVFQMFPAGSVNLKIRTGRFLVESSISDFSQPVFNMRCRAGYNEPSSIWRRSSDTALMCCASAIRASAFVQRLQNHQFQSARKEITVFGFLYHAVMVHRKYYSETSSASHIEP